MPYICKVYPSRNALARAASPAEGIRGNRTGQGWRWTFHADFFLWGEGAANKLDVAKGVLVLAALILELLAVKQ
jgi:hypothetical protein